MQPSTTNAALASPMAETFRPSGPLGLRQKLAYGCGDLSSNLVWGLMLSFITYYYTDIYVIPAAVVAWLLLIPRFFDAFLDPLFGYLVDRSGGRKVIPLMGWLAVPFGITAFLCFLPLGLSPTGKIVWASGTYLLLGAVYSALNTPYGVLSNMMATNTPERVSLNAFRLCGCQLGQFVIAATLLPAITWFSGRFGGGSDIAAQRTGVTIMAAIIGGVATILWLVTWRGCRVRRPLPVERRSLRTLLGVLAGNRRFHLSSALTYLNFTVFCTEYALAIHYTHVILGHPVRDASLVMTTMTVCAFIGTAIVPVFARWFDTRHIYLGLLACQLIGLALMFAAGSAFVPFLAALAFHTMALGPASPMCFSVLSEAIDEGRERTGIAAAGLAFATNTLVSKIAAAVSGFAAATFLAWGHYAPGAASADPTLAFWVKAGFLGIPACSASLAFALMFLSRRTDHRVRADIGSPALHG
jgi:GPH family glycoside/pentoside/hexuronide:cation symporter